MLNKIPFRADIQILRGISVLFVLLFHLSITGFDRGFLGVDVFFVISGYLMALLFDQGTPKQFYLRRIKRLVPAYAVTVVGTLVAASLLTIPVDFAQAVDQSLFAAGFVSNIGFWLQSSYFSKEEFSPLLNLWSLGVEMQFYLLIPLLYAFLKPRKQTTLLLLLLAFIASLAAADVSEKTAFYHMPFRVWEFLIGAYIAWNPPQKQVGGFIQLAFVVGLLIALLVPMQPSTMLWGMGPGITSLTVCALTGAILAYGMPPLLERSSVGNALTIIGRYSYSIYLVHFPIILLFNYVPFGGKVLGAADTVSLLKILGITTIASVFLYHLVEQKNAFIFKRPLALLIVAIVIAAGFALRDNTHYTGREKHIFSAWTDQGPYRCGKAFRVLHPAASICELTAGENLDKGNVLLVGNSHANTIKQSVAKIFGEHGMRVFFHVPNDPLVCPCYDGEHVMADVKKHHITAVVLHYNIEVYDDRLADEIERFAARLKEENIPVRIISPIPNYSYHIPRTMLEQPDMTSGKDLASYYTESAAFWGRFPTKSLPQSDIIDAGKVYCTPTCTIANTDNHPYYFDSNHLTLTGAAHLEPILARTATEFLAK